MTKLCEGINKPQPTRSSSSSSSLLAADGLRRIGLGTYELPKGDVTTDIVFEAIKLGYRHIDCAALYGNEAEVGNGIRRAIEEKIVTRDELWITSKLSERYHKAEHVPLALERTLTDLGLDYLDLYLIHWPIAIEYKAIAEEYPPTIEGKEVPVSIIETWRALELLVDAGKIKNIGGSNFDIQLLREICCVAKHRPLTNQVECHVFFPQECLLNFCHQFNIILTAYSPLVRAGVPYGERVPIIPNAMTHETVLKIAANHNKSPAQILLRWHLERSDMTVIIPKSANLKRLEENISIFDFKLSEEEIKTLSSMKTTSRINHCPYEGSQVFMI